MHFAGDGPIYILRNREEGGSSRREVTEVKLGFDDLRFEGLKNYSIG